MILRTAATLLAVSVACTPALLAQGQEDLIAKRDKKLASEWLKNADWTTDYDQARKVAKESGKPIFAYFTRSYAP